LAEESKTREGWDLGKKTQIIRMRIAPNPLHGPSNDPLAERSGNNAEFSHHTSQNWRRRAVARLAGLCRRKKSKVHLQRQSRHALSANGAETPRLCCFPLPVVPDGPPLRAVTRKNRMCNTGAVVVGFLKANTTNQRLCGQHQASSTIFMNDAQSSLYAGRTGCRFDLTPIDRHRGIRRARRVGKRLQGGLAHTGPPFEISATVLRCPWRNNSFSGRPRCERRWDGPRFASLTRSSLTTEVGALVASPFDRTVTPRQRQQKWTFPIDAHVACTSAGTCRMGGWNPNSSSSRSSDHDRKHLVLCDAAAGHGRRGQPTMTIMASGLPARRPHQSIAKRGNAAPEFSGGGGAGASAFFRPWYYRRSFFFLLLSRFPTRRGLRRGTRFYPLRYVAFDPHRAPNFL